MPNWTESMQQKFEYYMVDPHTWKDMKLLNTVKSCNINRDTEADTLGSASINIINSIGECYIRVYLITIQNGITEKHPLGTFLVQTPSSSYDGKVREVSMDAYTSLIELKEKQPPIGYYIPKTKYYKVNKTELDDGSFEYQKTEELLDSLPGVAVIGTLTTDGKQVFEYVKGSSEPIYYSLSESVTDLAYRQTRESARAPVVMTESFLYTSSNSKSSTPNVATLSYDFVSDPEDSWFSFLKDLLETANYKFKLDELGRILFVPKTDIRMVQPVWTYTDDNSSILYPEITMEHDLFGVPNVVEVVHSSSDGVIYAKARNEDKNSPTSIQNRGGREILYRVTDPNIVGFPTKTQIEDYAKRLLHDLSSIEYSITYSHGYCPVTIDDCVRLNYEKAGIKNIKARVVSQSIDCESGCKVTEKAVFTTNLISKDNIIVESHLGGES